jgi:hypothetical protein
MFCKFSYCAVVVRHYNIYKHKSFYLRIHKSWQRNSKILKKNSVCTDCSLHQTFPWVDNSLQISETL